MKFCVENSKDIQKYFSGSFVKFSGVRAYHATEDGEGYNPATEVGEKLFFVDQVSSDRVLGKYYTDQGQTLPFVFYLHPRADDSPEVDFILPRKSYFNHNGRAYYLWRLPARQYHRGITEENTALGYLDLDGDISPVYGVGFELLSAYVGKQAFLNFSKRDEYSSYAVSRRMAVASNGMLMLDRVNIGHVDYDKKEIHLKSDLFVPEVQAVVASHGDVFKVLKKKVVKKKSQEVMF